MQKDSHWETEYQPGHPLSNLWINLFLAVSLLACVFGALLIPSGLGFLAGYQELQTQNHESAIIHFNRGLNYLAENYPEMARAEFEIALRYDPMFEPAQQKLAEVQNGGNGTAPVMQEDRVAASLFEEARQSMNEGQWGDAIIRLEQIRTLKADYRTIEVNDLRYQAYLGGGKAAVALGQIELARERFEAALSIRNGDPKVVEQRDLAVFYLDGQQAVGYNWQTAIQKFSALYQRDPNYNDVKKRLFEAYVAYADAAAKQNSPCLAERDYNNALNLMSDTTVTAKRNQVLTLCRLAISATPTPAATPTLTVTVPTITAENYVPKASLATDKTCVGTGDVTGIVRDTQGRGMTNMPVGYYANGINLVVARTNTNGQYQFILGKDAGLLRIVILGADAKTPLTPPVDVQYPGGNNTGCHIVIDWQKTQ